MFRELTYTCKGAQNSAVTSSLRSAKSYATRTAPVYNKAKWKHTRWVKYTHHMRARPGKLKQSIRTTKVRTPSAGTYEAKLYSKVAYSAYQDMGFRHKLAKRRVRGKFFLFDAVHLVFPTSMKWNFQFELELIMKKAFRK